MALTDNRPEARVLIGFGEALAAPEVAASLLAAGHSVVAFARRSGHPPLRYHPHVEIAYIPAPEDDVEASVAALRQLPEQMGADTLLPLDDPSVWLCRRAFGSGTATGSGGDLVIVGPIGAQADLALDKRRQLVAAETAGLAVPEWDQLDLQVGLPGGWSFPVMVKPVLAAEERCGRLRRLSPRRVASPSDLAELARAWGPTTDVLVQRWIEGRGEGLFGLSDGGGIHHVSAHRRIRMMNPAGSGSSACASVPVTIDLLERVERFLDGIGWAGMFMVELLRALDGTAYFMELNGRPWGSMALARRLGFEYPAWAVENALRPEATLPEAPPFRPLICRHLGRELVHLLFVLRGRPASESQWPRRGQTLLDLRPAPGQRWYNCSPHRPGLLLYDTWRTVYDQLKGGVA